MFLLKKRSRSSNFVSIDIDQNTKVQAITSRINRFITKFFELVSSYEIVMRSYIAKSLVYRYHRRMIKSSLKLPKTPFSVVRAHFSTFRKNPKYMPRVFWAAEPKTGLGFEIGQPQQKI